MNEIMSLWDRFIDKRNDKKFRLIGLMLVVLFSGGVCWMLYQHIVTQRSQEAQAAFAGQIELYEAALRSESPKWDEIIQGWETAYEKHNKSSFAPYFLAFKSQAQYNAGQPDEARATMAAVVAQLPHVSPVYYVYAIKLALMKADAADAAVRDAGIKELDILAHDVRNPQWDWASYYSAYFDAARGETHKALNEWSRLVSKGSKTSIWAEEARQQLAHRAPTGQVPS